MEASLRSQLDVLLDEDLASVRDHSAEHQELHASKYEHMRNEYCPICGGATQPFLRLRFNNKMQLPTSPEVRHCAADNFLFLGEGSQADYDEYYSAVANDTCHQEVSIGAGRSAFAKLQSDHLIAAADTFFGIPRKVMDFGCGEACLLLELAINFPSATFTGFDPGPAASIGSSKARALGLNNLFIADLETIIKSGPFDLVIASHVVEHLLEFDSLRLLHGLLAEDGLLYVEVPDSLRYETHERCEFLYYFDRLHVNHFTPQSLTKLGARYGFTLIKHFQYSFPYRDGGEYPALGMLFKKAEFGVSVTSPNVLDAADRYIRREKARARKIASDLELFKGVLVWGAGDNFFRSSENCGPLSRLRNFVLLDRRPHEVTIDDQRYETMEPQTGIRTYDWPVVVTVSEGRKAISQQIGEIDPDRRVFFI